LTDPDLGVLAALGLKSVVDLRTATEVEDFGRLREGAGDELRWHHVPLFDGEMRLRPGAGTGREQMARARGDLGQAVAGSGGPGAGYLAMLGGGEGAATVFDLLTAPGGLPGVFHCMSGKDRTGMVAAMIFDLLGVPDETIIADYMLTDLTRTRSSEWITANEPELAAFYAEIPIERRRVRRDKITGFLAGVRQRFGSVEAMLLDAGLGADRIARLQAELLEG
jgi:protein-tyrosine phosphatase